MSKDGPKASQPNWDFCIFIQRMDKGDDGLLIQYSKTKVCIGIPEDDITLDAIDSAMGALLIDAKLREQA